ncbi:MAG: hypothetical protein IJ763_06275 [Lachnospiraceae bacterium]|nr:hypothetical protein [Lachnospiraceae bacterium]
MPLKIYKRNDEYINNLLNSGDVIDEIECGEKYYPVLLMCSLDRIGDAVKLLRKGYRCLHYDAYAEEFINILYKITDAYREADEIYNTIMEDEDRRELLDFLDAEYEELTVEERYLIGDCLAQKLYKASDLDATAVAVNAMRRYDGVLEVLRQDYYEIYLELFDSEYMNDHSVEMLLVYGNETFADDYAYYIYEGEYDYNIRRQTNILNDMYNVSNVGNVVSNKIIQAAFYGKDEGFFKVIDIFREYFSKGFIDDKIIMDLLTLRQINKLRNLAHDDDEAMFYIDTGDFICNSEAEEIFDEIKAGIKKYSIDNYDFMMLFALLIKLCDKDVLNLLGLDITDLEYYEMPCDYEVEIFECIRENVGSISFDYEVISDMLKCWKDEHYCEDIETSVNIYNTFTALLDWIRAWIYLL